MSPVQNTVIRESGAEGGSIGSINPKPAGSFTRKPALRCYLNDLADSIPGFVVEKFEKVTWWYVLTRGTSRGVDETLRHPERWMAATARFMETGGKSHSG